MGRLAKLASLFMLVALLSAICTGCHRGRHPNVEGGADGTSAEFTPYTAVMSEPSTSRAVRIYEGDKSTLKESGATFVGDLDVDAPQKISRSSGKGRKGVDFLAGRAAMEAAKVGATHFILVDAGVDVHEYTLQNAREETRMQSGYDQNGVRTTQSVTQRVPAQQLRTESPRARFALFRIDPARWHELPDALRPASIAAQEQRSTTRTTSGSAPGY